MLYFSDLTTLNQILEVLLSTNMAVGGTVGFILDNLLPGTVEERGIIKWKQSFDSDGNACEVATVHIYDPPFLKWLLKNPVCKWIPFLPYYGEYDVDLESKRDQKPTTTTITNTQHQHDTTEL